MKNLTSKAVAILSTIKVNPIQVSDIRMSNLIEQMDRNNPWSEDSNVICSAPRLADIGAMEPCELIPLDNDSVISFESIV